MHYIAVMYFMDSRNLHIWIPSLTSLQIPLNEVLINLLNHAFWIVWFQNATAELLTANIKIEYQKNSDTKVN